MREPKNFLKVFQKLSFSWFDNIIDEMTRVIELLGEVHKCSVKKFRIIRWFIRPNSTLTSIERNQIIIYRHIFQELNFSHEI